MDESLAYEGDEENGDVMTSGFLKTSPIENAGNMKSLP